MEEDSVKLESFYSSLLYIAQYTYVNNYNKFGLNIIMLN